MNKRTTIVLIFAILVLALAWKLTPRITDNGSRLTSSAKLQIAATISPLADIIKNIGGDYVTVTTILPPGASPHTFEPSPQQAIALQNAQLVFAIGHGFDDWVKTLASNAPSAKLVTPDADVQLRDLSAQERDADQPDQVQDPHYWLSIPNAETMARNIASALAVADSVHANDYAKNLQDYLTKLTDTDSYVRSRLSTVKNKDLITHHNAWGYFAKEYGLVIVGTFEVAPGREPTIQQLTDLQTKVKEFNLKTVYVEPQLSDQSIRPFVQDLKLNVTTLDPEGSGNNMGYIDLMRYNADTIAKNQ